MSFSSGEFNQILIFKLWSLLIRKISLSLSLPNQSAKLSPSGEILVEYFADHFGHEKDNSPIAEEENTPKEIEKISKGIKELHIESKVDSKSIPVVKKPLNNNAKQVRSQKKGLCKEDAGKLKGQIVINCKTYEITIL